MSLEYIKVKRPCSRREMVVAYATWSVCWGWDTQSSFTLGPSALPFEHHSACTCWVALVVQIATVIFLGEFMLFQALRSDPGYWSEIKNRCGLCSQRLKTNCSLSYSISILSFPGTCRPLHWPAETNSKRPLVSWMSSDAWLHLFLFSKCIKKKF